MDITLDDILDEGILESAYSWLCKRRRNYPDPADIWNFRRPWQREMARPRRELLDGSFRQGLLSRTTLENGEDEASHEKHDHPDTSGAHRSSCCYAVTSPLYYPMVASGR